MNTDKLHVMFYKRIFVFNLYNFIYKPSPFFSSKLENWNVLIGKLILFPSKKRLLIFFTVSFKWRDDDNIGGGIIFRAIIQSVKLVFERKKTLRRVKEQEPFFYE